MKETQMSTDFESRLKHMAAARDEAAMAAREAREREYAAKNALEQQSVRATQEADLLRRDLSRLQVVAAGAEAAGEESAGLRRQVREITQALDIGVPGLSVDTIIRELKVHADRIEAKADLVFHKAPPVSRK